MSFKDDYKNYFDSISPDAEFMKSIKNISVEQDNDDTEKKYSYVQNETVEYRKYHFSPVPLMIVLIAALFTASFVVASLINQNHDDKDTVLVNEISEEVSESVITSITEVTEYNIQATDMHTEKYYETDTVQQNSEELYYYSTAAYKNEENQDFSKFDDNDNSKPESEPEYTGKSSENIQTEYVTEITVNDNTEINNDEGIYTELYESTEYQTEFYPSEDYNTYQLRAEDIAVSAGDTAVIELTSDENFDWYVMFIRFAFDSGYIHLQDVYAYDENGIKFTEMSNYDKNLSIIYTENSENVSSQNVTIYVKISVDDDIPSGDYQLDFNIEQAIRNDCDDFLEISSVRPAVIHVY
ncbi:MAG: hypothetical protein ACI4JM_10815 [Oscillospiraceae bacterium]